MSFIKFVGKSFLLIVLLHASYKIFAQPEKSIKFVEQTYSILHPYLVKTTKPYFQLPPQMDAKTNKIPFDTITYSVGFSLGFFGILVFLFNSKISARILALIVLSFAIFIHNPEMHKQSVRTFEAKEGLLDIGIAGGLLVLASYQSNKKNKVINEKKNPKKEEQSQSSEQPQEQKSNDKQSQGNKKKKQ